MSIFGAIASVVSAGATVYSAVKGVSESKKQTKFLQQGNEEARQARLLENKRRKISESKAKIQQARFGRQARAKAVARGVSSGAGTFGSSFAGFGGSIVSTTSSNLQTINQFAQLDQSIFGHANQATIFQGQADTSLAKFKELQSLASLAQTGASVFKSFA